MNQNLNPAVQSANPRLAIADTVGRKIGGTGICILGIAAALLAYAAFEFATARAEKLAGDHAFSDHLSTATAYVNDGRARTGLAVLVSFFGSGIGLLGAALLITGVIVHFHRRAAPSPTRPHWLLFPFMPFLAWILAFLLTAVCGLLLWSAPIKPQAWFAGQRETEAREIQRRIEDTLQREKEQARLRMLEQQRADAFSAGERRLVELTALLKSPDEAQRLAALKELRDMGSGKLIATRPVLIALNDALKPLWPTAIGDRNALKFFEILAATAGTPNGRAEFQKWVEEHKFDNLDMKSPEAAAAADAAIISGKAADLNHLFDLGLSPDIRVHNEPLLFRALARTEMLQLILQHGANPNITSPDGKRTLLYTTLSNHNEKQSVMLIDAGADVNGKMNGKPVGDAPLFGVINAPDFAVASLLLDRGADVNVRNSAGQTPLDCTRAQFARQHNPTFTSIQKALLEKGAKSANELTASADTP